MKVKKINRDLKPTRKGDVILVLVPNYWGKGETVDEAVANVRKAGGSIGREFRVYSSHPGARIDEMGTPMVPADGHPSQLLQENVR